MNLGIQWEDFDCTDFRPKKLPLFNKRYQILARTLSRGSFSTKFLKINQTSEAGWQGVTKRVRHIFLLKLPKLNL